MLYGFAVGEIKINVENVIAVMWCVIAGMIIALVVTFFNKTVTGALVRLLLDKGGVGEENAKTPAELGIEPDASPIRAFKRSAVLQRVVSAVGEGGEEKYFIPTENEKRARDQYSLRGNELFIIILAAVAFLAFGALVTIIL